MSTLSCRGIPGRGGTDGSEVEPSTRIDGCPNPPIKSSYLGGLWYHGSGLILEMFARASPRTSRPPEPWVSPLDLEMSDVDPHAGRAVSELPPIG